MISSKNKSNTLDFGKPTLIPSDKIDSKELIEALLNKQKSKRGFLASKDEKKSNIWILLT